MERIVDDHDYDLALLANPYGPRRLANVRKLARLAREFEALRGPDLEGFLETVEVRRLAADREPDALVSEEDADAVRLMTVHAAKGLQFRVVVVADAGRSAAGRSDHLVALPDGRVGIKVPDAVGQLRETSAFTAASGIDALAEDAERRRVSYVALTRAVERLIISGVVRGGANEETPIAWMLRRLGASPSDGDQAIGIPGASVSVRVGQREIEAEAEAVAEPAPVEPVTAKVAGQLAFFDSLSEVEPLPPPVAVDVPPPLVPLPAAPPERPGRLSFSALSLFERCGYRFYAERLLGFRSVDRSPHAGRHGPRRRRARHRRARHARAPRPRRRRGAGAVPARHRGRRRARRGAGRRVGALAAGRARGRRSRRAARCRSWSRPAARRSRAGSTCWRATVRPAW